jgi:hypothetical protein
LDAIVLIETVIQKKNRAEPKPSGVIVKGGATLRTRPADLYSA